MTVTVIQGVPVSQRQNLPIWAQIFCGSPVFSISATMALPTTAPSEISQTARTCSGVEMPNPTATGSCVNLPHALYGGKHRIGKLLLHSRDARPRNHIDKTARAFCDFGNPLFAAGWSGQENAIQIAGFHAGAVLFTLFRSYIGHQNAIDSCRARVASQRFEPILEYRIEIAEKQQRHIRLFADRFQPPADSRTSRIDEAARGLPRAELRAHRPQDQRMGFPVRQCANRRAPVPARAG